MAEPPCPVAVLGGFDKGKQSFTAYCDCGKQHTMRQIRRWQENAQRNKEAP